MTPEKILELCVRVKAATGGTYLKIGYNGSGDSGEIQDVEVSAANVILDIADNLEREVKDLADELINQHHVGWENNDGAYGYIEIDMLEGTIDINHTEYTTVTTNDKHKVKVSEFLCTPKDRKRFWSFFTPEFTVGINPIKFVAYQDSKFDFNHDLQVPLQVHPYYHVNGSCVKVPEGELTEFVEQTLEAIRDKCEESYEEYLLQTSIIVNVKNKRITAYIQHTDEAEEEADLTSIEVKELAEWSIKSREGIKNLVKETSVVSEISLG